MSLVNGRLKGSLHCHNRIIQYDDDVDFFFWHEGWFNFFWVAVKWRWGGLRRLGLMIIEIDCLSYIYSRKCDFMFKASTFVSLTVNYWRI